MANYKAGFSMIDDFGRVSVRSFIYSVADWAAAVTLLAAHLADYQAATECHVFETRLIDETAVGGSPVSGANVDAGMSITVQLATANKRGNIQIPSPVAAVIAPDGTIDLTDSIMTDLLLNYTQATNKVTASDGELVTGFIKGTLDR